MFEKISTLIFLKNAMYMYFIFIFMFCELKIKVSSYTFERGQLYCGKTTWHVEVNTDISKLLSKSFYNQTSFVSLSKI